MADKKYGRGGKNPHLTTSQKKPCDVCGERVDHYSDGTVSRHKVYEFKVVNGVNKKTSKWSYCKHIRWKNG